MARIHYVRVTAGRAKAESRAHHSENRYRLGQNSTGSWYATHTVARYIGL